MDAIISNYYTNYSVWDNKTQNSLDNFVSIRLYHEIETLMMEEIDHISSYDGAAATNAITAFDLSDGVLLEYIIKTISQRVKDSCTYLVVQFLAAAKRLDLALEYKTTSFITDSAIIEFTVVSNELNKSYYLGDSNALQHY